MAVRCWITVGFAQSPKRVRPIRRTRPCYTPVAMYFFTAAIVLSTSACVL